MSRDEMIQKLTEYAGTIDPFCMGDYVDEFHTMTEDELKEQIRQAEEWLAKCETEVA